MTTEQITAKIAELSQDMLVATNSGTYGASECLRATGTGDTKAGEWRTYERIDGTRYTTGANPTDAPGRANRFSPQSAASRREEIAALKLALKTSKTVAQQHESDRTLLAKGWDGPYLFVGIDEGQRRLAAMNS